MLEHPVSGIKRRREEIRREMWSVNDENLIILQRRIHLTLLTTFVTKLQDMTLNNTLTPLI